MANKIGHSQFRSIGSVVPDLGGNVLVPTEVVNEELDVRFGIQRRLRTAFIFSDGCSKLFWERFTSGPQSVLFVGGFG
jgi:hypothetical protein